jgi:hypothetical protein
MDRGKTWTAISPDLTRSERRGDVPFGTVTTIDESPKTFGLLWAGTDDGLVHVSRDGGVTWREATRGLPAGRWVSRVVASHRDDKTAYVTLNGYRDDDIGAYVFRTDDLGQSWTDLSEGLPAEPVNVVREDPVRADVVYVGTDRGVYASLDRGGSWHALPGGMPSVAVHDLVVHPRDRELVAGTHGRSVFVLDVLPIQELTEEVRSKPVHVFPLEDARFERGWRSRRSTWFHRQEDEPWLDVPYWLAKGGAAWLTIRDEDDRLLRRERIENAAPGVNVYRWNLLLDETLAVEAERDRLREQAEGNEAPDRKAGKGKTARAGATEPPKPADTRWAEAVRLRRPLHATPGSYRIRITTDDGWAETDLVVQKPEPLEPRVPPKPRLRGVKGRKQGEEKKDGGR